MPVSSNSRVAKFIRETNIKDPLGVLYTLFHRNQGKNTKHQHKHTKKTMYKASELLALPLGFTPSFVFKIVPPPTTLNTHARDTSSNCRDKEPTPGTDEFITSPWRGDYASGWPTLSTFHYYDLRNEHVEPFCSIDLQSTTCAELGTMLAQRLKNPQNKFHPN